MAGGSAERSWSAGESGGSEALVALSEAVTRANESGAIVRSQIVHVSWSSPCDLESQRRQRR